MLVIATELVIGAGSALGLMERMIEITTARMVSPSVDLPESDPQQIEAVRDVVGEPGVAGSTVPLAWPTCHTPST